MLDLCNLRVTVMGLGRFGGGIGVTRFLAAQGADVLVTDLEPASKLEESLAAIADLSGELVGSTSTPAARGTGVGSPSGRRGQVSLRLGEHNVSDFTTCDLVIANPAVPRPWENRFLRSAAAAGVPITTEIGLLCSMLAQRRGDSIRVIAVTGSAGKSTTTAMIRHALAGVVCPDTEVGRCGLHHEAHAPAAVMGGNIGGSLLGEVAALAPGSWVVLELSSFMLWWLSRAPLDVGLGPVEDSSAIADWLRAVGARRLDRRIDPDVRPAATLDLTDGVALVTNISPNHLDWHGDLEHYSLSKRTILRALCGPRSAAVLVDESVRDWRTEAAQAARVITPGAAQWTGPLSLPGSHNRANAAGALEACVAALGEEHREILRERIAGFTGLEHRLQLAGEAGGVRFYNDSKSTTPESCLMALRALGEGLPAGLAGVHLIAGGYDKGSDLSAVARACAGAAGMYTIGVTGPSLARAAREAGGRVIECDTLARAFESASAAAKPGEVVLLSPACASWDQFVNFEARGNEFVRLVRALQS